LISGVFSNSRTGTRVKGQEAGQRWSAWQAGCVCFRVSLAQEGIHHGVTEEKGFAAEVAEQRRGSQRPVANSFFLPNFNDRTTILEIATEHCGEMRRNFKVQK